MDMLINNLCIDERNSVYIASERDICSKCLEEYVTENNTTYIQGRKDLEGKLTGQKIFKMQFHGATYTLCADHLRRIYELADDAVDHITVQYDELSEEDKKQLEEEIAGEKKETSKKGRGKNAKNSA